MKKNDTAGFRRFFSRFFLLFLLAVFLLPAVLSPGPAEAAGKGRRIHVVFDDSGSMGSDFRWSRAMYALEVFTAMLEEQDELKAYTLNMNPRDAVELSGSDPRRVEKIHQWGNKHDAGGTEFKMVQQAVSDLKAVKDQYTDAWLVVLTDGAFYDKTTLQIEAALKQWNGEGIRTIYLGIGSGASVIRGNPGGGGYAYKADTSTDILQNVRDIANRIFERLILPANHYTRSGDTYTLDIDVPTENILVFAQGENVRIGRLNAPDGAREPKEAQDVQYAVNSDFGASDTALKGTMAIYKDQNANRFTIDVSGSEDVEFYYAPAVRVGCELKTGENDPQGIAPGSEIEEGKYFVSGAFINPRDNSVIKSDLLDPKAITLTLKNNGQAQSFGSGGGEADLKKGTVTIEAVADLKTTELRDTKTYTVSVRKPKPVPAPDTVMSIRQDQLKDNKTIRFRLIIVDSETGQPVDEERWRNTDLEIRDQHGIRWDWTKDGMTAPNVEIIPSAAGRYTDADTGNWQFTVTTIHNHDEKSRLDSEFSFTVIPFEPFRVEDKAESVSQKLLKNKSKSITVRLQDPYNNDQPVSGGRWAHVTNLAVTDGDGIAWDCRRGPGEGEYTLTPRSADGKLRSVKAGAHEFTVTGTYDDGDLVNWTSTGKITLTVTMDPDKKLDLKLDVPPEPYPQSRYHMKNTQPIILTAMDGGKPIDARLWNLVDEETDMEVTVSDPDRRLDFEITKGAQPGTWEIRPLPRRNRGYETSTGKIRFTVTMDILDGEILYVGDASDELDVKGEQLWVVLEWFEDNLWWIIPLLLFLFFLSAYVFPKKKHLKTRKYQLLFISNDQDGTLTTTRKIKKDFASVITPFRAQRARLECNCPNCNCDFPNITIESTGKSWRGLQFHIITKSLSPSMDYSKYRIGNLTVKSTESLAELSFSLPGFSIISRQSWQCKGTVQVVRKRRR